MGSSSGVWQVATAVATAVAAAAAAAGGGHRELGKGHGDTLKTQRGFI